MPRVSEAFPSKTLCAAELPEGGMVITITEVVMEAFDDGTKFRVSSREAKDLIANKTNSHTIAKLYGDDTDEWLGKRIWIYPTYVDYQGRQVEAIRVKPKVPVQKAAARPEPARPTAPPVTQHEADMPDDQWAQDRE